jgi:hypothetical protein
MCSLNGIGGTTIRDDRATVAMREPNLRLARGNGRRSHPVVRILRITEGAGARAWPFENSRTATDRPADMLLPEPIGPAWPANCASLAARGRGKPA